MTSDSAIEAAAASRPAEPERLLELLRAEEHRLAGEYAHHVDALDLATAEDLITHANHAAIAREQLDYTRLRIQAAEADVRGENGTHVFQQASLRARYDDAWWSEATLEEAAVVSRYIAGWSAGAAKDQMTAELQTRTRERFGRAIEVHLEDTADPQQAHAARTGTTADRGQPATAPAGPRELAAPAASEPGPSAEQGLADHAGPPARTDDRASTAPASPSAAPAPEPESERALPPGLAATEALPAAPPEPAPPPGPSAAAAAAPADRADPRAPEPDASPAAPSAATPTDLSPAGDDGSEDGPVELPPLTAANLTPERLSQALRSIGADDVADTLPDLFAALDNPPGEDATWFADVDRGVSAFTDFYAATRQALPRLPEGSSIGNRGERWWLLNLETELEYQARRAGYPSLDLEDLQERARYAAMREEDLRAERHLIDEDSDHYDLLAEMLERRGLDEFGHPAAGTARGLQDPIRFDPSSMAGARVRVNSGRGVIIVGTIMTPPDSGWWWVDGHREGTGEGPEGEPHRDMVWLRDSRYGPPHIQVLQTAEQRERAEHHPIREATPGPEPGPSREAEPAGDASNVPAPPVPDTPRDPRPSSTEPPIDAGTSEPQQAISVRGLEDRLGEIEAAAGRLRIDDHRWGQGSFYTHAGQAEQGQDLLAWHAAVFAEAMTDGAASFPAPDAEVLAGVLARLQQPGSGDWHRDAAELEHLLDQLSDIAYDHTTRDTPSSGHLRKLAATVRAHHSSLSAHPPPAAADQYTRAGYGDATKLIAAELTVGTAYDQLRALLDDPGNAPGDRDSIEKLAAAAELATTDTSGGPSGHINRYRHLADQAQALADTCRGPAAVAAYTVWAQAVRHQAQLWAGLRDQNGVRLREVMTEAAAAIERGDALILTAAPLQTGAPIWIEHNTHQTIIHGPVTKGDGVYRLLKAGNFLHAPSMGYWKTNASWRYETRDGRVRELAKGLALAGRRFHLEQHPPGGEPALGPAPTPPSTPFQLPARQPFNTWPEAQAELRPLTAAFTRLNRSTAWRHMTSNAEDSRADAKALAALDVPGPILGADSTEVINRFTAVAQGASTLLEKLTAEGYYAPLLLPQLRELAERGTTFAARLHATGAITNRWPVVFKAPAPDPTREPTDASTPLAHGPGEQPDPAGGSEEADLQGSLFDFDGGHDDPPGEAAVEGTGEESVQQPPPPARQDDHQTHEDHQRGGVDEQARDQSAEALADLAAGALSETERPGGVLHPAGRDRRTGDRRPGGELGGGGSPAGDLPGEGGPAGDSPAPGREPDRAGSAAGGSRGRGEDRPADGLSPEPASHHGGGGGDRTEDPAGEGRGDRVDLPGGPDGHDGEPGNDATTPHGGIHLADEPGDGDPAAPAAPRFVPEGQQDLAPSGALARIHANLEAVRTVRMLQDEQRPATAAEQHVLARWSGWGAVPAVFDEREGVDGKPGPGIRYAWARDQLRELLSEDEYASARRNTINAHFTDAEIVRAIWDGLGDLGFSGGLVLEPGCGSGNFIGLAPAGTTMVGVEWDPTSAAIAAALYPDARIRSESFAATRLPEASVHAVVGNVPFGPIRLRDTQYNPGRRYPIHTHFIVKSLRLVAPGGLVALISSRYTMDGVEEAAVRARQEMGKLADLLGVVRLTSGAHRRAAGTDVVTDLIILRRREPDRAPGPVAWMLAPAQQVEGDEVAINEYFTTHPQMVLGTFGVSGRRQGDLIVRGDRDEVIPGLRGALQQIAAEARDNGLVSAPAVQASRDSALPADPVSLAQLDGPGGRIEWSEGFISVAEDGTFTQIIDGFTEPYETPSPMSAAEAQELRDLCGLRDVTLALLAAEERDDLAEMDRLRAHLNGRYDAYVARYGPINRVSVTPRLRETPEGHALRGQLLADGHARIAGGTFILTGEADQIRELSTRLVTEGLARIDDDGRLRMRQTVAGRAERDRLVAAGLARIEGGTLRLTDAGRAIALEADPQAISVTRRFPRQGGFRSDPFAVRVQGLERYSAQTGKAVKTDIFREPVMPARVAITSADSPADALAVCMDQHAAVRLDVIAELLGLHDEQQARHQLGDLVFHDPVEDRLVPAAEYLSGDVRLKLQQASAAAADDSALRVNVDALTAVIPEDLGPAEIEVRLGSVIIDPEHVQQFLRETVDSASVTVSLSADGTWKVRGHATGVLATSVWGTEHASATYLAERLLNQSAIKITKRISKDTVVVDDEATEAAQAKAQELNERFGEWIWEDLDRGELIARRYNDRFNAIVLRSYDDVRLSLPGLNRNIRLHWWQKAAVARMIAEPAVGLFHEMGAGKTLEQIIGMMELKRLGLINKPVWCVKNHMLDQARDEFLWAYPSARVLCADSTELTGEGKRRFIARCANENPDAVIVTRGAFEGINLSPQGVRDYLAYAEDFFSAHQDEMSVRDEETVLGNFREKINAFIEGDPGEDDDGGKKKRKGIDADPALTWEYCGFDYSVIDESQDYNNLWTPSNVDGMEIGFVRRCVDLEMKLHYSRNKFGKRAVTFATGTPVTNRIVQYHVLMRYLRPDRLKEAGFYSADSWLATFAEQETRLELKGDNTYGPVNRTSKLINLADMLLDIHHFGDFKTAEDIQLDRPALIGGKPEVRVVPATPELTTYQEALAGRYAAARKNRGRKGEDTCVAVIGDGFRAGQDLRLLNPRHGPIPDIPDLPQKVDALAADLLTEWEKHREDVYLDEDGNIDPVRGSLFPVFCNEGVPSDDWNLYDELRDLLVKGGMPRKMIRFIHETGSDRRKKRQLVADCNNGHVAVLVGSTEKMGIGTNFQRRVVGIYKMHPHWRPDYDDQEDARGRRPGNQNREIFIRKFITEGSYDVIRAQRCEMKASFLSHLKHRDPTVRTLDVPDEDTLGYAEVAALGAGDMRLVEKAKLDLELKSLVRAQRSHARQQNGLKLTIRQAEHGIAVSQRVIAGIDSALTQRVPTAGEAFAMTIDRHRHTKRGEAATHLRALLINAMEATYRDVPRTIEVGTLGGFALEADLDHVRRPATILLTIKGLYNGEVGLHHKKLPDGKGLITRLENRLANLETERQWHLERIPAYEVEVERARAELGKPFTGQDRMNDVRARISELSRQLTKDDSGTKPDPPAPGLAGPPGAGTAEPNAQPADGEAAAAALNALTTAQPRTLPDQLKTAASNRTSPAPPQPRTPATAPGAQR